MTEVDLDAVRRDLESFRSQLFKTDAEDDSTKEEIKGILDKYQGEHFQAFAEEYLITGFDLALLNTDTRGKVEQLRGDGELPSIRSKDATFWDCDRLLFCLMFDNEKVFSKGLKLVSEQKPEELSKLCVEDESDDDHSSIDDDVESLETWRNVSLIKTAVLRGLDSAVAQLGSINSEANKSAINLIHEFGRWDCLRRLLERRKKMQWDPVRLVDFISFLMQAQTFDKDYKEIEDGKIDFSRCVELLFKHATYEVNEQNDDDYSPLHLAVMYNKPKVIFDLMARGAYIGVQDKSNRPAIWNILPKTLEKHFDHCINGDDLIVFNFENLIAPSEEYPNDLTAIEYISNSNDLKYLLEHPLIAAFLALKWNRLVLIFFADLLCYFVLSLAIGVISMYYIDNPSQHLTKMCFFTFLFVIYATFRRILQMIFGKRKSLRSWESYLNSLLTILIIISLISFIISVPLQWQGSTLAGICIILITYEFFTLAGTFWHFSIYAEMFIAVTISSIKSLQLYAIFLPAFSLLFYILLHDPSATSSQPDLNKFSSIGSTMVKTIVMSAGEFDMINVNFFANPISIYVFIGFLFLISTVFMNLLNGLAVSDTQKIQFKAELTSYRRRCLVLARYEEFLSHKTHWFRVRYRKLWKMFKCLVHLNTFVYRDKRIYTELDDTCEIYSVKVMQTKEICLRVPLRSWTRLRTARLNPIIIRRALRIREKKEVDKRRDNQDYIDTKRDKLNDRIARIENILIKMETALQVINDKLDIN